VNEPAAGPFTRAQLISAGQAGHYGLDLPACLTGSAIDGIRHLSASLSGAAADMAGNLIGLALRTHAAVARGAPDDLLADSLDLLRRALDLLFS
jgi:hypothetical protein